MMKQCNLTAPGCSWLSEPSVLKSSVECSNLSQVIRRFCKAISCRCWLCIKEAKGHATRTFWIQLSQVSLHIITLCILPLSISLSQICHDLRSHCERVLPRHKRIDVVSLHIIEIQNSIAGEILDFCSGPFCQHC